ncbi:MAG TPA: sigma-54 dependent transcriptional regulator, partial [Ignavibacteriaceae bacterium]
ASTDVSVLIEGETGTGKELIARAIHKNSSRKDKPFIKVNCASIPENLIESELFGHERGAFTGATGKRIGRFEIANGGTIFLDEIGELPINLQPKLLTVLQQGEFERIGSSKTIKTDVRVIAATNKTLTDEIKEGNFRSDLYYRLNVFPITVAPLRERKEDIPPLIEHYVNLYSKKLNKPIEIIPKSAMQRLIDYSWPGNVRELENIIERAIIISTSKTLNVESLPKTENKSSKQLTLEENEINHIVETLEKTDWKISGPNSASELLKINPNTLHSRMRKLRIKRK